MLIKVKRMKCNRCKYEWDYGGRLQNPTCPNCGYKTPQPVQRRKTKEEER